MKRWLILLLASLLLLTGCSATQGAAATSAGDTNATASSCSFTNRELSGTWDAAKAVSVTCNGSTFRANGKGIALTDGQLCITDEGVYHLTGTLEIPVIIRADERDKVQLVLDVVSITTPDGPAILIESADKVFITLPEGTSSSIADSAIYTDASTGSPDAAIFSRSDLCINGAGSLTVEGRFKHGIVSKDDLILCGCTVTVNAASTALDGKDCIHATDAVLTVTAGTNGLRSSNDEDADRGFICLHQCTICATSEGDGLQAQTTLNMQDCTVTITAGGGSRQRLRSADGSWKGLKAGGTMTLSGNACSISSRDDCIHANGSVTISSGSYQLASGDDGIHADSELTVAGGEIVISQSYEGLEASKLIISGGKIQVTASDDGLNAAGGADGSGMGFRFGRGMFSNGVGEIIISGGYTVIHASGDGIDSNNTITVSGGVTLVSGPVNSANAAFDYDGSANVTGGVLIATGPSGMAQNFSDAKHQGAMLVSLNRRQTGSIALLGADGRVIASFTPHSTYQTAVITAPEIVKGGTYTVVVGGSVEGADANGYANGTSISGGSTAATITMTSLLYGSGGMHNPGGGGWHGR